jgi:LDH2 family malate/lactate/ureidoglycolate dehydrogenase
MAASGIAFVGVHTSYYSGRNAYYVEHIVRAGLVAIHAASARPHVVPPGGRKAALGTNPFSIGFPSAGGPVIYDIGTASLMWGEVLLMARLGETLPEDVGFDADGNPTRDADAVAKGGGVHRSAATRATGCRSRFRRSACSPERRYRTATCRTTVFCSSR